MMIMRLHRSGIRRSVCLGIRSFLWGRKATYGRQGPLGPVGPFPGFSWTWALSVGVILLIVEWNVNAAGIWKSGTWFSQSLTVKKTAASANCRAKISILGWVWKELLQ